MLTCSITLFPKQSLKRVLVAGRLLFFFHYLLQVLVHVPIYGNSNSFRFFSYICFESHILLPDSAELLLKVCHSFLHFFLRETTVRGTTWDGHSVLTGSRHQTFLTDSQIGSKWRASYTAFPFAAWWQNEFTGTRSDRWLLQWQWILVSNLLSCNKMVFSLIIGLKLIDVVVANAYGQWALIIKMLVPARSLKAPPLLVSTTAWNSVAASPAHSRPVETICRVLLTSCKHVSLSGRESSALQFYLIN